MNDSISIRRNDFDLDSTIEVSQGSVEYDSSLEAYRLKHDWSTNESLSVSVLSVIEVASKVSTDELPPLLERVDPDGLDSLFAPTKSGTARARGQVAFPYAGFHVTIAADGLITVQQIHTEETQ
jgi:hypothetical protein